MLKASAVHWDSIAKVVDFGQTCLHIAFVLFGFPPGQGTHGQENHLVPGSACLIVQEDRMPSGNPIWTRRLFGVPCSADWKCAIASRPTFSVSLNSKRGFAQYMAIMKVSAQDVNKYCTVHVT